MERRVMEGEVWEERKRREEGEGAETEWQKEVSEIGKVQNRERQGGKGLLKG